MSRHRRQRNRRWRMTLARASRPDIEYGLRVWERRGIITRSIGALEVLIVERLVRLGH